MPRPRQLIQPTKLRTEIDRSLHRRLVELCGQQTLQRGRVVPMSEMVREILGDAVNQRLTETDTQ